MCPKVVHATMTLVRLQSQFLFSLAAFQEPMNKQRNGKRMQSISVPVWLAADVDTVDVTATLAFQLHADNYEYNTWNSRYHYPRLIFVNSHA